MFRMSGPSCCVPIHRCVVQTLLLVRLELGHTRIHIRINYFVYLHSLFNDCFFMLFGSVIKSFWLNVPGRGTLNDGKYIGTHPTPCLSSLSLLFLLCSPTSSSPVISGSPQEAQRSRISRFPPNVSVFFFGLLLLFLN